MSVTFAGIAVETLRALSIRRARAIVRLSIGDAIGIVSARELESDGLAFGFFEHRDPRRRYGYLTLNGIHFARALAAWAESNGDVRKEQAP